MLSTQPLAITIAPYMVRTRPAGMFATAIDITNGAC
jgi:hypothetical protein